MIQRYIYSLITDARQWNTHGEQYLAGCQCEEVEPNERVLSAVTEAAEGSKPQEQRMLEGWAVVKMPQWSRDGLMEHIVELVVVDDQVGNRCEAHQNLCKLKFTLLIS
jgi:hypothetical protein